MAGSSQQPLYVLILKLLPDDGAPLTNETRLLMIQEADDIATSEKDFQAAREALLAAGGGA